MPALEVDENTEVETTALALEDAAATEEEEETREAADELELPAEMLVCVLEIKLKAVVSVDDVRCTEL